MAQENDRSFQVLKEKHPYIESQIFSDLDMDAIPKLISLSPDICLSTLKSFDRTTGVGPSKIRISHILDCILVDPVSNMGLLNNFSNVLLTLANGEAPESISSFVSGARLVALEKPKLHSDGFPDLRPIAVGELFRRWIGKILISLHRPEISKFFHPYQLGVGKRCGSEIIYKAVHSKLRNLPDLVLLQVDLTNAFNLCDRADFLHHLENFPKMYRWTKWVYGSHPWLFYGENIIPSTQGNKGILLVLSFFL
jgi:hypothetical protein